MKIIQLATVRYATGQAGLFALDDTGQVWELREIHEATTYSEERSEPFTPQRPDDCRWVKYPVLPQ